MTLVAQFRYPVDLIAPLRAAWTGPQWRGIELDPLPDDEVLLTLLETCFHASFTADEQRATRFEVLFAPPDVAIRPFKLERAIPFNVQELKRLAPAAFGLIGVKVGATADESTIWGFAGGQYANALTVNVTGPGTLVIPVTLQTVALHGGRATDSWSTGVNWALMVELFPDAFAALMSTIPADRANVHHQTYFGNQFLSLIERIAARGHGGTLFVIPEAAAENGHWRRVVRTKYPCDDGTLWPLVVASMNDPPDDDRSAWVDLHNANHTLESGLNNISRLTQVDGALVITDRLRVLGFGAEVTAPAEVDTVADGMTRVSIDDYGTRHRSAFRLCKVCPSTIAFVCSQDGEVKCVRNLGGDVTLIR